MNRLLTLASFACLVAVLVAQTTQPTEPPKPAAEPEKEAALPAEGTHPTVEIHTTLGVITLELDAQHAPVTVHNFITYADAGFYEGTIFHRVMKNFMIQGGGYDSELNEKTEGLGTGIYNEWENGLANTRGTIAMARLGGQPHSATAQFFINVVDNPNLSMKQGDGAGYAVFGKVTKGMDVVDAIRSTEVAAHPKLPMGPVVPTEPVVISKVKLVSEDYARDVVAAAAAEGAKEIEAERKRALDAAAGALEAGRAMLAETGQEIHTTESGLAYVVLQEPDADAASPTATSTVEVHYTGWFTDGKKFDSSVDRGAPATFPLNRVIPGWTEGLQLMRVGEKRKYLIPMELAYGPRGRPPVIPPAAPLVFDVELLGTK